MKVPLTLGDNNILKMNSISFLKAQYIIDQLLGEKKAKGLRASFVWLRQIHIGALDFWNLVQSL